MSAGARPLGPLGPFGRGPQQGSLFDAPAALAGGVPLAKAAPAWPAVPPAVPARPPEARPEARPEPRPESHRQLQARAFAIPETAIPETAIPETQAQMRERLLTTARQRVFALVLAFGALALVALVQIAWLGMDGPGPAQRSGAASLVPPRGEITDRNGMPLARVHPAYSLYFYPQAMDRKGSEPLVRPAAEIARELKAIIPDLDEARTRRLLASGKGGYLARRILPEQAEAVFALGEVAIQSPQFLDRHYPQGRLAAHVLGTVADDGERQVGVFGMEKVLNARLLDPTERATPVALSIDARVQGVLEDEMGRWMKLSNADGAAGVVLDVDTGEVMALASLPDFDPNLIADEDADNTSNRVTYVTGELGSVFKPLTIAAAIDAGVVSNLSRYWDATPIRVGPKLYEDYEDKGERLTIPEALAYSSNTVTTRVAQKLTGERLRGFLRDLGMDRELQIELSERGKPFWPQERKWSPMTTTSVAFGHGFNVTPLHLANAYAAMVNGGIYRDATLEKVAPGKAAKGRRVLKASTSQTMRQLLRLIAIYGTGRNADATGFRVGGKTGSAEKLVGGTYSKTRIIATFAAAFPMDRPRYVVVVSLDEPKITDAVAARTAYHNAAPIVGNLIRRAGPMLGVRPDDTRDVDVSDLDHLLRKDR